MTFVRSTVVATFTIQIARYGDRILLLDADELDGWINETEENLTDLLPEGYKARIERWDALTQEEQDE